MLLVQKQKQKAPAAMSGMTSIGKPNNIRQSGRGSFQWYAMRSVAMYITMGDNMDLYVSI